MSDSLRFDITSDKGLWHALAIAFEGAPGGKATHYKIDALNEDMSLRPAPRLILGWGDRPISGGSMTPFPLWVSNESATKFVEWWLEDVRYPPEELMGDGSTSRGWRVYNEQNGYIGQYTYSFVAIEPVLMYYGK